MICPSKPYTSRSPAVSDQLDFALLSGLEAHGGAGGDVQTKAFRGRALESQRLVGLEEVVVRAHLDGPITGVGDFHLERVAPGVDFDVTGFAEHFSGDHGDSFRPSFKEWGDAR